MGASLCIFFVLAALCRLTLAMRQRALFMQGKAFRRVLVLGNGQAAGDFIRFLTKRPWLGVACAGRLEYRLPDDRHPQRHRRARSPTSYIAASYKGFENLDRIWVASGASEVVVALDPEDSGQLPEITKLLSLAHVPFRVVPSLFEESYQAAELMGYAELPVIDVDVDPLDRVERVFKRDAGPRRLERGAAARASSRLSRWWRPSSWILGARSSTSRRGSAGTAGAF